MNEISESIDFIAKNEQYGRDGDDIVRFVHDAMVKQLETVENDKAYLPEGITLQQFAEVCSDVLSEVAVMKWDEGKGKITRSSDQSLLFAGNPSERMKALREGTIDPSPADVVELLGNFMEAASYTDYWPGSYTLKEFGHWLSATGQFDGNEVAEVIW